MERQSKFVVDPVAAAKRRADAAAAAQRQAEQIRQRRRQQMQAELQKARVQRLSAGK